MPLKLRSVLMIAAIATLPFAVLWAYWQWRHLPGQVTIATGPLHGEWHSLSHNLLRSIETNTEVDVATYSESTGGALHHLELLNRKEVDFALYLRGSRRLENVSAEAHGPPPLFIGNLYSDLTLFVVRRDLYEQGIQSPDDFGQQRGDRPPYRIAVGRLRTGEHSIAEAILNYYFADDRDTLQELNWDYQQVEEGFRNNQLDAALISAGHQAPIFHTLLEEGLCGLGRLGEVDAIVRRNVGLSKATVPTGLFRYNGGNIPQQPLQTVSTQTMLLAHEDVSPQMVEKVTRIILSEEFILENQLFELSQQGRSFASSNPEFAIHPGAMAVYDPRLKPLVDPEFMDATENLRSFGVSLLIAGFLVYQWYRRASDRRKAHRLDEYFHELLRIDRSTIANVVSERDAMQLQQSLEDVVELRNKALRVFTAKDFDEDSAADSFLQFCETVAAGMRSRLLRWQLKQSMEELVVALRSSHASKAGS